MVLHCASRLGVISYLHSKRHDIAFSVGLIQEVPIAMCNADHFTKTAPLLINDHDDSDKSLPSQLFQAREITLFFETDLNKISKTLTGILLEHNAERPSPDYTSPDISIFHPPCEA